MSNEILDAINKIPPFTRYYLASVILTSFMLTYNLGYYVSFMLLDYDKAIYSLQIWRLITNFCIVGKFSFGFLFFVIMMHQQISGLESKAISLKKYSEFLMMFIYLTAILLFINFIFKYKMFMSMELLFALLYIASKRDPEIPVSLWGFKMKYAYLPFAFLLLSMLTGGDVFGDIIGLICGHIYYYLKDVVPLQFRKEYLITPKFMARYDSIGQPKILNIRRNNFNDNTTSTSTNNNNNERGSFQPFSGRGTTLG